MKAKIYTKTGDQGQSALVGGRRVSKDDPRLEAYGTVDELNSCVGLAVSYLSNPAMGETVAALQKIQNELFNLGSRLACEDEKILTKLPTITADHIGDLEKKMDLWESELEPLKNFILPGGTPAVAALHLARTICRRAERRALSLSKESALEPTLLIYLNRLSDFLFTLARKVNALAGVSDIPWEK
jgi:cob(I)alamin adenosyltransferase